MTIAKSRAAKILAYVLMFKSNRYLILVNILHITLGNKTSIIIQHFCRFFFSFHGSHLIISPIFSAHLHSQILHVFLSNSLECLRELWDINKLRNPKTWARNVDAIFVLMRLRKRLGKTESSPTSKSKSSFLYLKDLKRPKNSIEVITDWNLWTDRCPPQLLDCEITSSVVAFVLFLWFFLLVVLFVFFFLSQTSCSG